MRLTESIRQRLAGKKILLMAHLVLGYPSFEANRETVRQMVEAGVDLIELQIPFSEPMADGPVIALANQEALARGTTVRQCLDFARETVAAHPIPFLFMTYCNIVIQHGLEAFCRTSADMGIQGFIVPDLPPEEGGDYLDLCARHEIAPILIYAPTSTDERMRVLASHARGLIYCVARRGVTGAKTSFGPEFDGYMERCRQATSLPLAVGFGLRERSDVDALVGKAEIAVVGSETIRLVDASGVEAVGPFMRGLREI